MTNYEKMWKLLVKEQFQIDSGILLPLRCAICQKIAIDACNAPCQCNFCKRCLEGYLENGGNICPGNSKTCKKTQLNIGENISKNDQVNDLVANILVPCSSDMCDYKCQLIKMYDHTKLCSKRLISCLYRCMGCSAKVLREQLSNHLQSAVILHNKLLVQWTQESEVKRTLNMESRLNEISKELQSQQIDLLKCVSELQMKNEVQNQLISDLDELKKQNGKLKLVIYDLKNKIEDINTQILELKINTPQDVVDSCKNMKIKEQSNSLESSRSTVMTVQKKSSTLGMFKTNESFNKEKESQKKRSSTSVRSSENSFNRKRSLKGLADFIHSFN